MTISKFGTFYREAFPFLMAEMNRSDKSQDDSAVTADIKHSGKLIVKAGYAYAATQLMRIVTRRFLPHSEAARNLGRRFELRAMDAMIGVQQHEILPLTMARRLPEPLRTQDFANYAKDLALPHLASAIEASVTYLAPRPQEANICPPSMSRGAGL